MSDADIRDAFAAAALTGLLAQGDDGSFSEESYVRAAYRWADAMLRERANHIPDAGKMVETPGGWRAPNGCHPTAVWHELLRTKEKIKDIADDVCGVGSGVTVNSPMAADWLDAIAAEYHRVRIGRLRLTDTEAETIRELIDEAGLYADEIGLSSREVMERQETLRGLLERTGVGK